MPKKTISLPTALYNVLISTLATRFEVNTKVLRIIFPPSLKVIPYGRTTLVNGGDIIHARELVKLTPDQRDMSFIRVRFR
jgi:hypothetical protein